MRYAGQVEYAQARRMRERNKPYYRLAHWPIWIWVFFLAPGPLTFSLFAHGFGRGNLTWLIVVLAGTGIAGLRGKLPGVEERPYILRFDEDKPNPLYRKVCYTFAWNAVLSFALLNLAGLVIAVTTGRWYMKQIYDYAYFPLCAVILLLGVLGWLPRVGRSTKGEGTERRYFYGSVWGVVVAQALLLAVWKTLPWTRAAGVVKLGVCGRAGGDGDSGGQGSTAADEADFAGGVDGGGLTGLGLRAVVCCRNRYPTLSP